MRLVTHITEFSLILLFLTIGSILNAQNATVIERVEGKVIDATTGQELGFCSAALYMMPQDSLVSGVLVNENGKFTFNNIRSGNYLLRIRFIGYTDFEQKVNLAPENNAVNLGILKVKPVTTNLNEVEVVTEKSLISMTIDRKVYNIEKDLSVTGGTGIDAVKNIPSVSVDADGSVSLRNSGVEIFIDGKQSNLTLEQIPAGDIEKIEVITNPSAKYDANTSGGILNVILKKNRAPGYNGSITGGIGTNDRYNTTVSLNVKQNKWGVSLNTNYVTQRNNNKGFTNRENISNPVPIKQFEQTSLTYFTRAFGSAKIAVDYFINEKNTLTLGSGIALPNYRSGDFQDYISRDTADLVYSFGNRLNETRNSFFNYNANMSYKKEFAKPSKELFADANYSYGANEGSYLFTTNNYLSGVIEPGPELQKNTANGHNHLFTLVTDFSNPINDSSKYEVGAKIYFKQSRATNGTYNFDYNLGYFINDTILSNDYLINDMVNAAYFNYSSRFKKVSYQVGLRFEQSYYNGEVLNKTNQNFSYNFPSGSADIFKSLFPSIYLSKKTNENQEFQVNFSRKIRRPGFIQLLPIVLFADKFNYRIGNPALQPEFINLMELNYNYVKNNINYLSSVFGKHSENAFILVGYPSQDDANVLINTWQNSKANFSYGWENILKYTAFKILNITTTITPYYLVINYTDNKGKAQKSDGYCLESKLMLSLKLPKGFTFQTNGTYEFPKPLAQGKTTELYFFDLSLNKKFKNNITANIILSDVLNSHQRGLNYFTPDYNQYLMRRRDSRFLKLNITWTFGKADTNTAKKKSNKIKPSGTDNSEGGEM